MNSRKIPVIAVVGSSNIDLVVKTPYFPLVGETVFGKRFFMYPGGKGANQAVSAARLGARVNFISRVGKDFFGDKIINNLKKEGIKTDYIIRDPLYSSGIAFIIVDKKGDNTIVVASGANSKLCKKDIEKNKKAIFSSNVLVLQLEIPFVTVEYAVNIAKKKNIPVILNPAPYVSKLSMELLSKVDILTPNKIELQKLTGEKLHSVNSIRKSAGKLLKYGTKTIVVTLGEKGSLLVTRKFNELIPSKKVNVVDTTGAGDTFTGALAFAISCGEEIRDAVYFANCVAALSVTKLGAQSSMPTIKEIKNFLRWH